MRADPARADRPGRDLGSQRLYRAGSAADLWSPQSNPRLRRQTGLARLGRRQRPYAAKRAARSDRRAALADTGGRELRASLRSYAGAVGAAGGEGARHAHGGRRSIGARDRRPPRETVTWRRQRAYRLLGLTIGRCGDVGSAQERMGAPRERGDTGSGVRQTARVAEGGGCGADPRARILYVFRPRRRRSLGWVIPS